MFELTNQKVKLSSLNARAELHGEERKPAFDLKFEAACSNDALIHFHPELRQMLYKKADAPDLVEQTDPEALTALRFPKLGTQKWDWEGTGYTLTVPYGVGGKSDIKLGDCQIDDFRFAAQNGGTVIVTWRTICHPKTDEVGKLCEFIQREIDITLTPPEAKNVQELFGDDKKKPKGKDRKEANLAEAQKVFVAGGEKAPEGDAKQVLNPAAAAWPFPGGSKPAAA